MCTALHCFIYNMHCAICIIYTTLVECTPRHHTSSLFIMTHHGFKLKMHHRGYNSLAGLCTTPTPPPGFLCIDWQPDNNRQRYFVNYMINMKRVVPVPKYTHEELRYDSQFGREFLVKLLILQVRHSRRASRVQTWAWTSCRVWTAWPGSSPRALCSR